MTKVTIEFDNPKAAEHFQTWLCEAGEQDYWEWMDCREQEEEDDNITAVSLHYNWQDLIVTTTCGRLDN